MRPGMMSERLLGLCYLILINGAPDIMGYECQENNHLIYTVNGPVCCPKCHGNPNTNFFQPCDGKPQEIACRCAQNYGCALKSCSSCKQLPSCKPMERLNRTELPSSVYEYTCVGCPEGEILEKSSGMCKSNKGSVIDNSTASTSVIKPTSAPPENIFTLVLFSSIAAFILLLITTIILLLICKMKFKAENGLLHVAIPTNRKEDGDTYSCQFPEEEHGDGTLYKGDGAMYKPNYF